MANTRRWRQTDCVDRLATQLPGRIGAFLVKEGLEAAQLCVGLSGGLDSVVLLHVLAQCRQQLPFTLTAAHVHHGLSEHATSWSEFAVAFAESLSVPCEVYRVTVDRCSKEGIEAAARRARYAVYASLQCDAIMLAHHRNDQAETTLLQLVRGSGIRGLAAMPVRRRLTDTIMLVRPLLDIPRAVLQTYAVEYGLSWVEDESNTDTRYRRNFLRHTILPQLEEYYPQITSTLTQAAQHFADASVLLQDLALLDFPDLKNQHALPREIVMSLSFSRQRNLLYWYLLACGVEPADTVIEEMIRLLKEAGHDSQPQIRVDSHCIYLDYRAITVVPEFTPPGQAVPVFWRGESQLEIPQWRATLHIDLKPGADLKPDTEGMRVALLQQGLTLMPRQSSATLLRVHPHRPRQSVKHLWQQNQVPAWQRKYLPFVYCENALVWVPYAGLVVNARAQSEEQEACLRWVPWDFQLP